METGREDARYFWFSALLFSITFVICNFCVMPLSA